MHPGGERTGGCTPRLGSLRSISAMGGAPRRRRWAEGRGAALTGAARACRAAPSSARPTAHGGKHCTFGSRCEKFTCGRSGSATCKARWWPHSSAGSPVPVGTMRLSRCLVGASGMSTALPVATSSTSASCYASAFGLDCWRNASEE
jgi:hypothetical protein